MHCAGQRGGSDWLMIAVDPTSPEHGTLCPRTSDLDFLGDLNGIVNLDAKISNRALDLRDPVVARISDTIVSNPP